MEDLDVEEEVKATSSKEKGKAFPTRSTSNLEDDPPTFDTNVMMKMIIRQFVAAIESAGPRFPIPSSPKNRMFDRSNATEF